MHRRKMPDLWWSNSSAFFTQLWPSSHSLRMAAASLSWSRRTLVASTLTCASLAPASHYPLTEPSAYFDTGSDLDCNCEGDVRQARVKFYAVHAPPTRLLQCGVAWKDSNLAPEA